MTITSENSPYGGQAGRVRRVFWRQQEVWVLMRLRLGGLTALPWSSTDLPLPTLEDHPGAGANPPVLLSPAALRELARFLQRRPLLANTKSKNQSHV